MHILGRFMCLGSLILLGYSLGFPDPIIPLAFYGSFALLALGVSMTAGKKPPAASAVKGME